MSLLHESMFPEVGKLSSREEGLAHQRTFFVLLRDDVSRYLSLNLCVEVSVERRHPFTDNRDVLLHNPGDEFRVRSSQPAAKDTVATSRIRTTSEVGLKRGP